MWASKCLQHVARPRLPLALAGLHRALDRGGVLDLTVFRGDGDARTGPDDDFPDRLFTWWQPDNLVDVLVGAGFTVDEVSGTGVADGTDGDHGKLCVRATRPGRCPTPSAPACACSCAGSTPASTRPTPASGSPGRATGSGRRYWPSIVSTDRSPDRALADHGIGMTDIVKRATVAAADLTADEYRAGLARVERLVGWLRPGAVCFVGLAGWRAAVDRRAVGRRPTHRPGGRAGLPHALDQRPQRPSSDPTSGPTTCGAGPNPVRSRPAW